LHKSALKGHGFSRAEKGSKKTGVLTPEGSFPLPDRHLCNQFYSVPEMI
jgi:hypothetical protein